MNFFPETLFLDKTVFHDRKKNCGFYTKMEAPVHAIFGILHSVNKTEAAALSVVYSYVSSVQC